MNSKETREKMKPLCICSTCPTYVECVEEVAFCLAESGKSNCIKDKNGCLCGGCPVQKQMGFEHHYYCILGPEKDQSK